MTLNDLTEEIGAESYLSAYLPERFDGRLLGALTINSLQKIARHLECPTELVQW